jgi:outer membrane protein TolC
LATSFIPNIFQGKPDELVAVRFGTSYNPSYGVAVDQLLYSQTFWTGIKATKEVEQLNKLSEAKTAEDVAYNVVKLYYQVQTLSKQRELVNANIEQVGGLYKATNLQYQNGLAKKIDVDQLRVNLVTLGAQRQNLDLQFEQALQGLKFAMAMPLDAPIVLTDTLEETDLPVLANTTDQNASYKNKIDLMLLDKQTQLLQLNTDVYKAGFFPTLSFRANFNRQGQGNNIDQLKWFNNSVLALNLQVPLFDGFKKSNQIQQASIERLQVIEDRKRTEQALQLQYSNARQQLYSTLNTLTALKENGVVAQEVFNITQKRFKEGLGSITEVLVAERTMREVKTNYFSTLLQYRFALIDLDYANGKLMQLFN